jgi:lysylphosphatidylglycerol synthetase-like protein (DUF2156 family)
MQYLMFILADIVFGYTLQATGCAICLFVVTNQSIKSRKFLMTCLIFSGIAVLIRMAYNIKLIDFGFHTIIIWFIFILVSISYNRFPVTKSILSTLLSGILITVAELVTAAFLIALYGNDGFTMMMNNTQTLEGRIIKAVCGIPANVLFMVVVLIAYYVKRAVLRKKAHQQSDAQEPLQSAE